MGKKAVLITMSIVLIVLSTYLNMANKGEMNDYDNLMQLNAGINLGNALDSYIISEYEDITDFETSLHNCKIRPSLFEFIKRSGFSTVRIPITWMNHLDDKDVIDPVWLEHVGNIVTWALNSGLYVVVDVHHDTWMVPSYENRNEALRLTKVVWGQIAEYFKDFDQKLIFEGFNEPRLIGTDLEWKNGTDESYEVINHMNRCFVNTVRETGGNNTDRYLLISGYRTGTDKEILDNIEIPEGDHIALAVHAYIPYEFVSKKNGTTEWNNNGKDTESIDLLFSNLESFSEQNNIPDKLYCNRQKHSTINCSHTCSNQKSYQLNRYHNYQVCTNSIFVIILDSLKSGRWLTQIKVNLALIKYIRKALK